MPPMYPKVAKSKTSRLSRDAHRQDGVVVVVALGADASASLRQPVGVEHHGVARRQDEVPRHEMRRWKQPDGLAADRVDVVRAPVRPEYQSGWMAVRREVDVEPAIRGGENPEDDRREAGVVAAELLAEHLVEVLQHSERVVV